MPLSFKLRRGTESLRNGQQRAAIGVVPSEGHRQVGATGAEPSIAE